MHAPLPSLVNLRPNQLIVKLPYRRHLRVGKCRNGRGRHVLFHLCRPPCAGDDARYRVEHQDPTQGPLRERGPARQHFAQLLHRFQAGLVIHAGECLALVEHLAMAIELAMVVGFELRIARQLAGQKPAGQRHAHDDAHVSPFGFLEE